MSRTRQVLLTCHSCLPASKKSFRTPCKSGTKDRVREVYNPKEAQIQRGYAPEKFGSRQILLYFWCFEKKKHVQFYFNRIFFGVFGTTYSIRINNLSSYNHFRSLISEVIHKKSVVFKIYVIHQELNIFITIPSPNILKTYLIARLLERRNGRAIVDRARIKGLHAYSVDNLLLHG